MTAERWKKIEEVYHAAMAQPAERRAQFVTEACPDVSMRAEVQSLLDQQTGSFLDSAPVSAIKALSPGARLGHFEVVELIGKGGMGEVYRARDTRLKRDVAIKVLPAALARDADRIARFEREARAAGALNHPNIVAVYEIGHDSDSYWIATELVTGEPLNRLIERGPLEARKAVELAAQIADGLSAAHSAGIVHRDLKPGNIMVARDGHVKILDFGLARRTASGLDTATLTEPGMVMGTAGYMAPEQVRGETADQRADLFSFGVVLYEMLAGKRAFTGNSSVEVMHAVLKEEPPSLPSSVPPQLGRTVLRCLEKDPARRFQSAADLSFALQSLDTQPPGATPGVIHRRSPVPRVALACAIIVALGTAIAGWLFYFRKAHQLTEADSIVVAAFANSTGDPVFDDTLSQALATDLQQSPFFSILPDRRVNNILKLMGHSPGETLTVKVATELCERAGGKAVLAGSIAALGSAYVLGLNAISCQSGSSLAREEAQAPTKERVLDTLHATARSLRRRLGESFSSLQRFDTNLLEATTPSLEALHAYSKGRIAFWKGDPASAVPLLQQAIRIDPNFAMAYLTLGLSYGNLGESGFEENWRKAYELREHVSEWERFAIESRYDHSVSGNLLKARQTTQLWAQTYPKDALPIGLLADIGTELGQYDHVIEQYRAALRLDPTMVNTLTNLANAYMFLNRPEEARAAAEEVQRMGLDTLPWHVSLYLDAFSTNDLQRMADQVHWFTVTPGMQAGLLYWQAATAAYHGQLKAARELSRRLLDLSEEAKDAQSAADCEGGAALREALLGNPAEARKHANAAPRLSTARDVVFAAALALAISGDAVQARLLADDLAQRFPEDTIVKYNFLPAIRGQLAMGRKEAIEILSAATPYELACRPIHSLYPIYVRGLAYLALKRGNEAAAEFVKLIKYRALVGNSPYGPLAHVGLARAYVLQGDLARARASFESFLSLWKGADPGVPIYAKVRAEYEGLKSAEH
jgi:serine/threonine protein kinase/tetratricopeptide (TPR) repeat protein